MKQSIVCNLLFILLISFTLSFAAGAETATVRVQLTTDLGAIEIEIYTEAAPVAAANFLQLVDGKHLDGGSFYRTVSPHNDNGSPVISVIQGGIGDAEGPFAPIPHETTEETGLLHVDGAFSMARGDVGTASTEFFICVGDQPALDYGGERNADGQGFAAFGRVVSGMEIVKAIHGQSSDAPTESAYVQGQILDDPVVIESVRRVVWPDGQSGATLNTAP